jgi:GT2 family glycosyltransferase
MPFFSVIIPTHNRCELLLQALESVVGQSYTDYEVIVVDDGSTDDTARVVERIADEIEDRRLAQLSMAATSRAKEIGDAAKPLRTDNLPLSAISYSLSAAAVPRIRVIRQENKGPGAARNLGVRHAAGEYLAFLDSDDLWFPWSLEVCQQVILQSNFPSIVSAKLVEFSEKSELKTVSIMSPEFSYYRDYFESASEGFYVGAGMLFIKKFCFEQSGGFTEAKINLEDHDLVLRCGTSPGFAAITVPATLAWRRHQGGLTKVDQKSIEGAEFIITQEKHGNYPGGSARKKQRIQIICSHVRAVSMGALAAGHSKAGWSLFWKCFAWNVLLRRWKYVFGFPIKALSN